MAAYTLLRENCPPSRNIDYLAVSIITKLKGFEYGKHIVLLYIT